MACTEPIEEIVKNRHGELAGLIIEPLMQAAAGMIPQPPGYLKRIRDLCTRFKVLLIADEVATGFGRTGTMFACEHEMITPDPCPLRGARRSDGSPGRCPRGPNGVPKNSSIRSRSSSGTGELAVRFSCMTVVMFTTAGVTCFATSAKPFPGAVMPTGMAFGDSASDACDTVSEWPPQSRAPLRRPIPIPGPIDRCKRDDMFPPFTCL
jgi:hypothetical protein